MTPEDEHAGQEIGEEKLPELKFEGAITWLGLLPQSAAFDQDLRQAIRMTEHHVVAGVDGNHRIYSAERLDALLL